MFSNVIYDSETFFQLGIIYSVDKGAESIRVYETLRHGQTLYTPDLHPYHRVRLSVLVYLDDD